MQDKTGMAEAERLAGKISFNSKEGFYSGPLPELLLLLLGYRPAEVDAPNSVPSLHGPMGDDTKLD